MRRLPAHPRLQVAHEIPLVEKIRPPLERGHACAQFQRPATRRRPPSATAGRRAVLARELQREVAAERISGGHDPIDPSEASVADDVGRVARQPRVIEARAEVFGAAAVPLVQQQRVEPARRAPCRRSRACSAPRSTPRGRAARGSSGVGCGPPASSVREHLRIGRDLETAFGRLREIELPGSGPAVDRHRVAPPQPAFRGERRHHVSGAGR